MTHRLRNRADLATSGRRGQLWTGAEWINQLPRIPLLALAVAVVWRTGLPVSAQVVPTALPPPALADQGNVSTSGDEADSVGPDRLKDQIRIVPNTNAPSVTPEDNKSFHWKFACQGWEGLDLEVAQHNMMGDPFAQFREQFQLTNQWFHLEQVKMTAKIGGRLAVDGAGFVTTGNLADFDGGVELRRLRINARGDCILLLPVSYQIELGYIPGQFDIEESFLAFPNLGFLGTLKMGQYRTPFSLDNYTSTRDIRFMEPAAPVTALAPGVNAGLQVGGPVLDNRMTWTLGFFGDGGSGDFGDASQDYGRAVIRLTGLPVASDPSDDPSAQQLLHVGLNFNSLYSASSSVRYRTRPESHLAPYVLDTGDIDARSAFMLDAEAAWINGPLSIQGEFIAGQVNETESAKPTFYGFYAQTGWFLTGESRPYIRSQGRFGLIVPRQDFHWHGGGWGAWEIVGRLSYTDLDSENVSGGRMGLVTAAVNWHPTSHIHWAFNFITGQADGPDGDGWMNIFETRVEVNF